MDNIKLAGPLMNPLMQPVRRSLASLSWGVEMINQELI